MTQIHIALRGVMRDIGKTGIAKLKKNTQQNYNFRGIEDAMNELNPLLVNNGITVTPSYSELAIVDRVKGDPADAKATRFATIKGAFRFEAEDGSSVVSECYGEAMDSGDKAVTKAQSVAFRTALFQQFVVPFMSMDPEYDDVAEEVPPALLEAARAEAMKGWKALAEWIKGRTPEERALLAPESDNLKNCAKQADAGSGK